MAKPDLEFTNDGLFATFFPATDAGKQAWLEMEAQGGSKVLVMHLPAIKAQLKAAGYTVRKARPSKPLTVDQLKSMLAELES